MVDERQTTPFVGSLLFPRLFQTFRMAIQPTRLILAFLALSAICLAGHLMDYSRTVVVEPDNGQTELDVYVSRDGGRQMTIEHIHVFAAGDRRAGVFGTLWSFGSARFHSALLALADRRFDDLARNVKDCLAALLWALTFHPIYSLIFFGVTLVAISIAGGALCRIAALQFSRGEKPGLIEALRFGAARFGGFLTAPLIPIGIMAALGAFIVALGLLGNARYVGELSIGLFVPLALMIAAPITVFMIGALTGFNLMFPTIAYEDSDGFDAISRSFSYVYARPWHMGFYTLIAVVYGAACYAFVRFFSLLLIQITRVFLQFGFGIGGGAKLERIWPQPPFDQFIGLTPATPVGWPESVAAFLIHLWVLVVAGLMVSFVIAFYFSANTIIYALMRNRVDKTPLTDVHTRLDEMEPGNPPIEPGYLQADTPMDTPPDTGKSPGLSQPT